MRAKTRFEPLRVFVLLFAAVSVLAAVNGPGRAAGNTAPGRAGPSCTPLSGDVTRLWKPSDWQLKRILARHLGWEIKTLFTSIGLPQHDAYLEQVEPGYADWRREALRCPERADLRNADLDGKNLSHVELAGADLRGAALYDANLAGADLVRADFSGSNLEDADLTKAYLWKANLNGSSMFGAKLGGADLHESQMSEVRLDEADLKDARLDHADLSGSSLFRVNLSGADLFWANLSGADFKFADVSKAKLDFANLTNASYDPQSEPPDPYVVGIVGLSTLHVEHEFGLIQLRKLLQDAGLHDDERAATYAIERNRTTYRFESAPTAVKDILGEAGLIDPVSLRLRAGEDATSGWIEGFFRVIAFDATTAYGLYPSRALGLIVVLGVLFTAIYMWAILRAGRRPNRTSGIYQVFPADRVDIDEASGDSKPQRTIVAVQDARWWRALGSAAYFSLLAAVNIGFEQFTPGDWIRRLQAREYSLEAVGWVRVVAGIQALLSVFLLAMWVLTYFGHPFE